MYDIVYFFWWPLSPVGRAAIFALHKDTHYTQDATDIYFSCLFFIFGLPLQEEPVCPFLSLPHCNRSHSVVYPSFPGQTALVYTPENAKWFVHTWHPPQVPVSLGLLDLFTVIDGKYLPMILRP